MLLCPLLESREALTQPNRINLFLRSAKPASTFEFSAYIGPQVREKGYSPSGIVNLGYSTIPWKSLIDYNLTDEKLQRSRESPMM